MNSEPNHHGAEPVAVLPVKRLFADPAAPTLRSGFIPRLSARVHTWFEIPYGYQNETGFHYGRPEWDRDQAAAACLSRGD